ncbi:MAG: tetratricopeptide repeat protein [Thermodesulfobacteriota bacterium]
MRLLISSGIWTLMFFFLFTGFSYGESAARKHYYDGVEFASNGNFALARDEFKEALHIDPRRNAYKNSLKIIEDIIALHVRKEAAMHAFVGIAHGNKGDLEKAIKEYTKALEIDAQFAGAYNNRGSSYQRKGQYDLAIADHTKAIEIDPQYAGAYNNRGGSYQKKGQYDLAIADFTKAIEIAPELSAAYINRGSVYDDKGLYERAIVDYTKALDIDPLLTAAYNNRGISYSNNRQFENAIKDFNQAIDMEPENTATYYNRGISFSNSKQFYRAISDYKKAIEIDPNFASAYDNLGFVYLVKLGDKTNGCKEFKMACRLGKCDNYNIVQVRGICSSLSAERPIEEPKEKQ